MIMNTRQILADLDKHASEFNFPVLDNAYIEFGAARLTAFQDSENWLIVFEILGFSTREIEFVDDLYAYGSCIEKEGLAAEEIPLRSSPEQPILDAQTNECIADWCHWSIQLGNETISFSPTREEYAQAGVKIDGDCGKGTLREIELLRFLIHCLGEERLFMNDRALLDHFPRCTNMPKFVQTTRWQHPDVSDGEIPSKNVSIRSLVDALLRMDPDIFDSGRPNTEWKPWARIT